MAEVENTKLTIQIPEGVDVDIESVPTGYPPRFDDQAALVKEDEAEPPPGYGKAYRWDAACTKVKLTIRIPEGVDVDIQSVPTGDPPRFDAEAAPVKKDGNAYRWDAACKNVESR